MSARKWLVLLVPLVLSTAACGDDETTSTADTASEERTTPVLTFDGADCVGDGPMLVSDGLIVVEFVNSSDSTANIVVMKIDEGWTVDDVVEDIGEEPATGSGPAWLSDMGAGAPAASGESLRWERPLDAGEYALLCSHRGGVWFGSGLTVVQG